MFLRRCFRCARQQVLKFEKESCLALVKVTETVTKKVQVSNLRHLMHVL